MRDYYEIYKVLNTIYEQVKPTGDYQINEHFHAFFNGYCINLQKAIEKAIHSEYITVAERYNKQLKNDLETQKCYKTPSRKKVPKLDNEQCQEIVEMYAEGYTQKQLAYQFKISQSTVSNIISRYYRTKEQFNNMEVF